MHHLELFLFAPVQRLHSYMELNGYGRQGVDKRCDARKRSGIEETGWQVYTSGLEDFIQNNV